MIDQFLFRAPDSLSCVGCRGIRSLNREARSVICGLHFNSSIRVFDGAAIFDCATKRDAKPSDDENYFIPVSGQEERKRNLAF